MAVHFHDVLHDSRAGRATGTASLKSKLLKKLTKMREKVLYKVFLDLQKAYEALDLERCTEVIVGSGVGPQSEKILKYYWGRLSMVDRAGCYYGTQFKGHRGFT